MRITHPQGSLQHIIAEIFNQGFVISCGHIIYDFRELNKDTIPSTVLCRAIGAFPKRGLEGFVKGTIVYDPGSGFLVFTATIGGLLVEISFEISGGLFTHSFSADEQTALSFRMDIEERKARFGW